MRQACGQHLGLHLELLCKLDESHCEPCAQLTALLNSLSELCCCLLYCLPCPATGCSGRKSQIPEPEIGFRQITQDWFNRLTDCLAQHCTTNNGRLAGWKDDKSIPSICVGAHKTVLLALPFCWFNPGIGNTNQDWCNRMLYCLVPHSIASDNRLAK